MSNEALFPQIDTPALLIDVDVLERNLDTMAASLAKTDCGIRPHFKAHRILEICQRQIARGAHGVTCAKLGEAEVLAQNGIEHLLVANEVVGPLKWERLAHLARKHRVSVAVDTLELARDTAAAMREHHATVGVLVDLNVGLNRCGITPGKPALELAQRVSEMKGLKFRGLMAYEGHAVLLPPAEKEAEVRRGIEQLTSTAQMCRDAGLEFKVVSAGGTGTWNYTSRMPGVTELQAGTYSLMDILFHDDAGAAFDYACTVLSTVISRPTEDRAITDAGKKAIHPSFGMSRAVNRPGVELSALHSEHGVLELEDEARNLKPGDRLQFIPYYLEGTVNLYDYAYAIQGGKLVGQWKVLGRGKSQ